MISPAASSWSLRSPRQNCRRSEIRNADPRSAGLMGSKQIQHGVGLHPVCHLSKINARHHNSSVFKKVLGGSGLLVASVELQHARVSDLRAEKLQHRGQVPTFISLLLARATNTNADWSSRMFELTPVQLNLDLLVEKLSSCENMV